MKNPEGNAYDRYSHRPFGLCFLFTCWRDRSGVVHSPRDGTGPCPLRFAPSGDCARISRRLWQGPSSAAPGTVSLPPLLGCRRLPLRLGGLSQAGEQPTTASGRSFVGCEVTREGALRAQCARRGSRPRCARDSLLPSGELRLLRLRSGEWCASHSLRPVTVPVTVHSPVNTAGDTTAACALQSGRYCCRTGMFLCLYLYCLYYSHLLLPFFL